MYLIQVLLISIYKSSRFDSFQTSALDCSNGNDDVVEVDVVSHLWGSDEVVGTLRHGLLVCSGSNRSDLQSKVVISGNDIAVIARRSLLLPSYSCQGLKRQRQCSRGLGIFDHLIETIIPVLIILSMPVSKFLVFLLGANCRASILSSPSYYIYPLEWPLERLSPRMRSPSSGPEV